MTEKPRILVVDDEQIIRNALRDWFSEDGYPIHIAADAQEALDILRQTACDIILLDIRMPGMDGLELQTHIVRLHPQAIIIIMTAYASVDTAVRALKAGAYDYVQKPIEPETLQRMIEKIAVQQRLARENQQLKQRLETLSSAMAHLTACTWSGHAHEKENAIERTAVVQRGDTIRPNDLSTGHPQIMPENALSLAQREKHHIQSVLDLMNGNITQTARALDIDRVTLYNKIKKYGLKRPGSKQK